MDIEVLGALSVRVNGVSVVPTAPKPRHVLALLALHADQVVPVGVLVEELWGAKVPRSARTTLQTYILQLRELIGVALAAEVPVAPAVGPTGVSGLVLAPTCPAPAPAAAAPAPVVAAPAAPVPAGPAPGQAASAVAAVPAQAAPVAPGSVPVGAGSVSAGAPGRVVAGSGSVVCGPVAAVASEPAAGSVSAGASASEVSASAGVPASSVSASPGVPASAVPVSGSVPASAAFGSVPASAPVSAGVPVAAGSVSPAEPAPAVPGAPVSAAGVPACAGPVPAASVSGGVPAPAVCGAPVPASVPAVSVALPSAASVVVGRGGGGVRSAKEVLVTVPGGYRLVVGGGVVDFRRFEALVSVGYRAMDGEDFAGAARVLGQALGLWSGPALTDVSAGLRIGMEARRLEEARLCALDQRIEADLRLGRHRELLPELTVLVNTHRMHESLHGQFMLALHRSGRRGEALDVYQRLRSTLVAELGLEPSPALVRLQRSILMARPEPPAAAGGGARRLVARTG